eukprot:TRINITY_DN2858_c0_g1_i19.p1 TRINITY_DN2858_c0_g1~~TRINITY_DN2858_c0_g1_i19.p1  ORF type:complete len:326 (-),score=83.21 TRINITY_DN2858_c0_g1_i19:643-1620(-)
MDGSFSSRFDSGHEGLVHDIAYDFFGKRLATASSDRTIRLFERNAEGAWAEDGVLSGHKGSIWRVRWAHPEFGQVLVSCSYDGKVRVWEEKRAAGTGSDGVFHKSSWVMCAELSDARSNVADVQFSPRHLGLRFAACSHDGFVRVYEAVDVLNLSNWSLTDEFEAGKAKMLSCLSWDCSTGCAPSMVIGDQEGCAKIWEYSEQYRKWHVVMTLKDRDPTRMVRDVSWAPNLGRSYGLIAAAFSDGSGSIWRISNSAGHPEPASWELEKEYEIGEVGGSEMWRVEWNITGTALATSSDNGTVQIYHQNIAKNTWEASEAPIRASST